MDILKLLVVVIVLHVACAFTQMVWQYYTLDIPPDDASVLAHTTMSDVLPTEADPNVRGPSITDPGSIVAFVARIGDLVNNGVTYNYSFVEEIRVHGGLPGNVAVFLQLVGFLVQMALGAAILRIIFDSGVLTSKLAALVLVGGLSLTSAISWLQGLFG